jgi:hypothetical protein
VALEGVPQIGLKSLRVPPPAGHLHRNAINPAAGEAVEVVIPREPRIVLDTAKYTAKSHPDQTLDVPIFRKLREQTAQSTSKTVRPPRAKARTTEKAY